MVLAHEKGQQLLGAISKALKALPPVVTEGAERHTGLPGAKRRVARRMKELSVDLDLLKGVAGRWGIAIQKGKGKGYDLALSELLGMLEQGEIDHAADYPNEVEAVGLSRTIAEAGETVSQTIVDQAKTLAWLTGRIEGLEADLVLAHQGKEPAHRETEPETAATEALLENLPLDSQLQLEIGLLQHQNERLSAELYQTQAQLQGIQQFLATGTAMTPLAKVAPLKQPIAIPSTHQLTPVPVEEKESTSTQTSTKSTAQAHQASSELDPDALKALDAILNYNDKVATAHHQHWTISIPVMKDLLKQVGKSSQPKIDAVLKAESEKIKNHHRLHGLGERHNRIHQGTSLSDLIHL
jgi:hypothetical protein